MQRFTISLDDALAAEFDRLIAERGYGNRSEAVRDLLRGQLAFVMVVHIRPVSYTHLTLPTSDLG